MVDKTGTLTEGRPAVTSVVPGPDSRTQSAAPGCERRAGKRTPLARAILAASQAAGLSTAPVAEFDFDRQGALGVVEGRRVVLGNPRFLADHGVNVDPLEQAADELRRDGATVIFVGVDGRPAGVIAIADPIKPSTLGLAELKQEGIRVVMLTGDNRTTAEAVARRLGIAEVEADVLPEQKCRWSRCSSERAGSSPWRETASTTRRHRGGGCRHRHGLGH